MDIKAKVMKSEYKAIIDKAYHACMRGNPTEEQILIWELANAVSCARIRWITNDIGAARKILYEHDYTIGTN